MKQGQFSAGQLVKVGQIVAAFATLAAGCERARTPGIGAPEENSVEAPRDASDVRAAFTGATVWVVTPKGATVNVFDDAEKARVYAAEHDCQCVGVSVR